MGIGRRPGLIEKRTLQPWASSFWQGVEKSTKTLSIQIHFQICAKKTLLYRYFMVVDVMQTLKRLTPFFSQLLLVTLVTSIVILAVISVFQLRTR